MVADRRRNRHAATRREILDAAWRLAERDGIAGLSLREIAREVGMQAPSLYTYFDAKDAIYDAMFAEGYEALVREMVESARSIEGGSVERLTAGAEAFLAFCQASPARYQLMFTYAVPGWRPSPDAYSASTESYRLTKEFAAACGIGTDADLDLYTAVTAGLAAQQMANDPEGDRWRRQAGRAMEMLVGYLGREQGEGT